jgi:hypothetical protein
MNEVTMEAMRERIIGAVSPYVEIESPDLVEVGGGCCRRCCWSGVLAAGLVALVWRLSGGCWVMS